MASSSFDRYPECRKQVAVADRLVITKSDIAEPGTVAQLTAELARLNPAADILDAQALDALAPLLETPALPGRTVAVPAVAQNMGSDRADPAPQAEHTPAVAALAFTLEEPIEWSPFSVWLSLLLNAHGEKVLRFKALLNVSGWSGPGRCSTAFIISSTRRFICPPGPTARALRASL